MPGDVAAVATLLNTILTWLFDQDGYAKWSRERKLAKLQEAFNDAMAAEAYDTVDLIFAEMRRIARDAQSGP